MTQQNAPQTPKKPTNGHREPYRAALQTLLGCRPMAYYPRLADLAGSVKAAVMLSQLLYWNGDPAVQQREGWLYKSVNDMTAETGLSKVEQQTAREQLTTAGLINARLAGMPRIWWYQVDLDKISDLLAGVPAIGKESHPMGTPSNGNASQQEPAPTLGDNPAQHWDGNRANIGPKSHPTLIESETTSPETTTETTSSFQKEESQQALAQDIADELIELGIFPDLLPEIAAAGKTADQLRWLIGQAKNGQRPAGLFMARLRSPKTRWPKPLSDYTQYTPDDPAPCLEDDYQGMWRNAILRTPALALSREQQAKFAALPAYYDSGALVIEAPRPWWDLYISRCATDLLAALHDCGAKIDRLELEVA